MSWKQLLRSVWARKWLAMLIALVVGLVGIFYTIGQPKTYTAEALLVLDVRPDPILGNFVNAASLSTQLEILKSERMASRVVGMLGLDKKQANIDFWRKATQAKIPIQNFLAIQLLRGLSVEPVRGSNIITITFAATDPVLAAAGANAFARAAVDTQLDMRVEPARQSAEWFNEQAKGLRTNLEQSQARLAKFQQDNGIVVTDQKVDQENDRLTALSAQLVIAQTESADAAGRQRVAGDSSLEVQQSALAQGLKAQLAAAETKLAEVSNVMGSNHPQRIALESQIAGLRAQLSVEIRRVANTSSAISRATMQKVEELRALVEAQKQRVLDLRGQRDAASLLLKDVEAAQRAYDSAHQRGSQLSLESQTNQTNMRVFSTAVEPLEASQKKFVTGILGSITLGLALGILAALALDLRNRRVRGIEDLLVMPGVPVIGLLRAADSRVPVQRRLAPEGGLPGQMLLPGAQ